MSTGLDYRVRTSDGVDIALHRIHPSEAVSRAPGLLAPGTFTGRDFWVGAKRQGFALALAEAGFDTWVVEMRGHGALLAPPAAVRDLLDRFGSADREMIVTERAFGFSRDHDHPGLMIGSAARDEIWPRVLEWLHREEDRSADP